MEQVPMIDLETETECEARSAPSSKRLQFMIFGSALLLVGAAATAVALARQSAHGGPSMASFASVSRMDDESTLCWMMVQDACGCTRCRASFKGTDGEEMCLADIAGESEETGRDLCSNRQIGCDFKVGQKYTVECSGQWDTGGYLQIGNYKACNGKEGTEEFTAEASPPKASPKEQYASIIGGDVDLGGDVKGLLHQIGWTGSGVRSCLEKRFAHIYESKVAFDDGKDNAVEWDDLDPSLRDQLSIVWTCATIDENHLPPEGIPVLKRCLAKPLEDMNTNTVDDDSP